MDDLLPSGRESPARPIPVTSRQRDIGCNWRRM